MSILITRLIPAMQVAGALKVLVLMIVGVRSGVSVGLLIVGLSLLIIFGLGVLGAIRLWRNEESGRRLCMLHQALIMPKLALPGFIVYDVDNLAYFDVGMTKTLETITFGFNFGIAPDDMSFFIFVDTDFTVVGLNLVALAALLFLYRWPRWQARDQQANPDVFD